jgi:flagellar hook-associated protein 3 FlgL
MRVTDTMLFERAALDGGAARTRAEEAMSRASTGLKLARPGDDPSGAGQVVLDQGVASRASAIATVATAAGDELTAADSALNDVTSSLARLREIAVQFANGTYDAAARANAATEVRSLQSAILASLNTRVGDRYVFAGTADGAAPFDAAGNYSGDTGVRQVEVAPGVWESASVRADVAFKGVGGGTDLFAALNTLTTALQANDAAGVAAAIDPLARSTTQLATARGQLGNAMNVFDNAAAVNRTVAGDATTRASHLTDADQIQAATDLALAQRALEASLSATSSTFKFTLLNYLK